MKGQAAPNYRKRKSKKVESNLNLGTHNQIMKAVLLLSQNQAKTPPKRRTIGQCP
jgi:hypothetical protein